MISKYNDEGCLKFFECVTRGNEDQSYVGVVTEVPSTTKLMQVALALERLKIEFDKLVKSTDGIAEY